MTSHPGTLHRYTPRLVAFEHGRPDATPKPQNYLLWVGGLSDGLLTVTYPALISSQLPPNWALAEILISSSYRGWGTSSLARDAREIASAVSYFRGLLAQSDKSDGSDGKVVLMGHSTGCQDVMEYLTGKGHEQRPKIDGAILQAPVSDREGMVEQMAPSEYHKIVSTAREFIQQGKGADCLPLDIVRLAYGSSPVSAERMLSLLSPDKNGDDDYFSSDLPDERLNESFGGVGRSGVPFCVLWSGNDQFTVEGLDIDGVLERWKGFVIKEGGKWDEANGGIVKGASHNLEGDEESVRMDLATRVKGFIGRLEKGEFGGAARL